MSCSVRRAPLVDSRFILTPAARAILGGTAPANLQGSGRQGRITKFDALQYLSKREPLKPEPVAVAAKPVAPVAAKPAAVVRKPQMQDEEDVEYTDIPVSTMRRVIATRLGESKQAVPHTYATMDVKIDRCLELRSQFKQLNFPVPSMNDLVIKASALALRQTPKLNIQLANQSVTPNSTCDVSVAVATKAGLITPIIREADNKSVNQISSEMKDLAARAKDNKLKPAEFQGGSFTVSNLGMLGIADFTAIINLPQSAILAVGSGKPVVAVPKTARTNKGEVIPLSTLTVSDTMMSVTLSFDGRIVDPITASQFLQSFKCVMESPAALI